MNEFPCPWRALSASSHCRYFIWLTWNFSLIVMACGAGSGFLLSRLASVAAVALMLGGHSNTPTAPRCYQFLCVFVCACFSGGLTFCLLRTLLLKRDIGLLNVSLRREPCVPPCSFLCECCEVAHECDSVMAGLGQLYCCNIGGAPT